MIEQCKSCKNKEIINGIVGCVYMDADCQNGEKYEAEIITNADRIRAMSDEELAGLLLNACVGSKCGEQPLNEYGSIDCFACRMKWLKQPAEEVDHE